MKENFGNKFVSERFLSVNKKQTETRERTINELSETEGANKDRLQERLRPTIERMAALEAKQPGRFLETAKRYLEEATIDINNRELISKLAQALFDSEKRIAIERGYGADVEQLEKSDPTKEQIIAKYEPFIIDKYNKQKESLETWFSYLEQNDANYPFWFRYYTARTLRDMGKFERDTTNYSTRTEDTLAPFPELNAEALSFVYKALEQEFVLDHGEIPKEIEAKILAETVLDSESINELEQRVPENRREQAKVDYLKKLQKQARKEFFQNQKDQSRQEYFATISFNEERRPELEAELNERLSSKNFAKLYAFAQVETAGNIDRNSLEGEWVKYDQGSDPRLLESALKGKGTGWCTATGSAKEQLEAGDFYVFFTKNKTGVATEPRVAIRMENGVVAEIRGIDPGQELEPILIDTAQEFYKDLPGAEQYEQATADMKQLTDIYNRSFTTDKETGEKIYHHSPLTKEEFFFLYEVHKEIQGFGYKKDPRINELKEARNLERDLLNLPEYKGLEFADIIDDLIKNHCTSVLCENIEKISSDLHSIIADKILSNINLVIESGAVDIFARTINNFSNIDHEKIALQLIRSGLATIVAFYIGKFPNIDTNLVAISCLNENRDSLGNGSLDNLYDLGPEILNKLLETTDILKIIYYFRIFDEPTRKLIVEKLLGSTAYINGLKSIIPRDKFSTNPEELYLGLLSYSDRGEFVEVRE